MEDFIILDCGTAVYWTGGLQNIGMEDCRILDKMTAEYWNGGLQNIG
jgi:hypothetical protein